LICQTRKYSRLAIRLGLLCLLIVPSLSAHQQFDEKFHSVVKELSKAKIPRPAFKSFDEAWEMTQDVHFRVYDVVKRICKEENITNKSCMWSISVERNAIFNAYASRNNKIVISSGLIDQIKYEDELAFVIAHEIAHHLLNHITKGATLIISGQILGTILFSNEAGGYVMASLLRSLPSRQFETNADALAIKIVELAGYDLKKARYVLMRMAKLDPSIKSRILESHPAGVERIVAFDKYRENL